MALGIGKEEDGQEFVTHIRAVAARPTGSRARAWVRENWATALILGWILVFAFSMRITNVNWDKGQHLHPDERFLMIVQADIRGPSSVGQYFNTNESPLNPYQKQGSFVYGTFPLFLNKAVSSWLSKDGDGNTHASADAFRAILKPFGVDMKDPSGNLIIDSGYNSQLVGRVLSAIFDVFTVALVFELGRVLYRKRVGLLAAALMSVSVLNIQYSHFFGSETFLVFFMTATIYFSVRIWKYGGWPNYLFGGLVFGMALASKLSALPVLVVPVLAILMRMWPQIESAYARLFGINVPWRAKEPLLPSVKWGGVLLPIAGGLAALVVTGVIFRIFQPYAFNSTGFFDVVKIHLDLKKDVFSVDALVHLEFLKPTHYFDFAPKYKADIDGLINLQKGADFPPNIQWIDRPKYIFPLNGIFFWGWGIPLSLATAGGLAYAAWRLWRRDGSGLILVFWTLFLFWFIGRGFTPTIRYFLPIYPTMAILAAFGLVSLWDFASSDRAKEIVPARLAQLRQYVRPALRGVAALAVIGGFLWALAFINVYRQDISRVQASRWIAENLPKGSKLTSNEWDDGLPLAISGVTPSDYPGVRLKPYANDNVQKVQELVAGLDQADYVVESSNRVYATVPRIPARYPNTYLYYKYLFDGTLGFQKVASFHNYPKLFGITIPDQSAEESFTVYDHPAVTIWKKTDAYSHDKAINLLQIDRADTAIPVTPKDAGQNAIEYKPDVLAKEQAGGTFSDIFHPGNVVNRFPLIFWLLAMELAAFSLVPLAVVVFRGLPDRGFLLTKPLGILALAYLAYAPASRGLVSFTRAEIAAMLALMIVFGLATGFRWRAEVMAWMREHWRFVLFAESVFLLAFLFSYWLRLQNPDLWHPYDGGEKPMDFAYLNGVIKTTDLTQGPIDPWHAGGYLNYYWFGQFIAATVTKLTGIVPEVAYNLLIPMFFALAAAATFSVAYNLTEGTRRLMKRRPGGMPISARGPIIAGLLAIFLVLIAGNLRAVDILEQNLSRMSPWHSHVPLLGGIIAIVGGFKAILFHDTINGVGEANFHKLIISYDWWAPSRALTTVHPAQEVQPITEFPFWTFLFADLHAHLMAMPFAMTATGVGLGAVFNFTRLNPARAVRGHSSSQHINSWVMVGVIGLIVGALRWINSWDYPPFLIIGASALFIGERARVGRFSWGAMGAALGKTIVMGLISYVLFSGISKNYSAAYNGFHQSDQTTALEDFFSHFGILLFLMTGFILFALNRAITRDKLLRGIFFGGARRRKPVESAPVMLALVLAAALLMYAGSMERWGVTLLAFVGLVAMTLLAWREARSPSPIAPIMLFVYAMATLGLGLVGGVEIFTLDGDIGRMNTVFKFYLHVWLMWGVVASFATWYVFGVMKPQEAFLRRASAMNAAFVKVPRYAFAMTAVLLLALALVYPYFGTRARIHDRFDPAQGTGNDGLAFLDDPNIHYDNTTDSANGGTTGGLHNFVYTRDGVDWIRANIKGSPSIIESFAPSYRSLAARVSIYTGLPTVVGYGFHQEQQRANFGPYVQQRERDVNEFYTTTDIGRARHLLAEYAVSYVIVGDEERFNYPATGLAKFKTGLGGALELVYENPGMQVWHVIPQDELATANAPAP